MNRGCHNVTLMYASSGREQEKHHCFLNNSLLNIRKLPPFQTQNWPKLFKSNQISAANGKSQLVWSVSQFGY